MKFRNTNYKFVYTYCFFTRTIWFGEMRVFEILELTPQIFLSGIP